MDLLLIGELIIVGGAVTTVVSLCFVALGGTRGGGLEVVASITRTGPFPVRLISGNPGSLMTRIRWASIISSR